MLLLDVVYGFYVLPGACVVVIGQFHRAKCTLTNGTYDLVLSFQTPLLGEVGHEAGWSPCSRVDRSWQNLNPKANKLEGVATGH